MVKQKIESRERNTAILQLSITSRNRILATERAASWLSKHFTYWWLEQNGHDSVLIDSDGL